MGPRLSRSGVVQFSVQVGGDSDSTIATESVDCASDGVGVSKVGAHNNASNDMNVASTFRRIVDPELCRMAK